MSWRETQDEIRRERAFARRLERTRDLKRAAIFFGIVGLLWLWPESTRSFAFDRLKSAELSQSQCQGKPRCVVAYVTPWCGACKAAAPTIKGVGKELEAHEDVGFMIVVGQDTSARLKAEAKTWGSAAWLDADGTVLSRAGGRGVPHWFTVDENQVVVSHFPGTASNVRAQIARLKL